MAFRFSLETVLRLRENLEHTESLLLERRYAELAQVQGMLWEAEQNIVYSREQKNRELDRGTTTIQLQLAVEEESRLREHRDALVQKLQEAQALLREQLSAYRKARQKRDILQELRKQKFDLHRREQEKSEQSQSDEAFLLRRKDRR
jgi:flagellar export protein FliJ